MAPRISGKAAWRRPGILCAPVSSGSSAGISSPRGRPASTPGTGCPAPRSSAPSGPGRWPARRRAPRPRSGPSQSPPAGSRRSLMTLPTFCTEKHQVRVSREFHRAFKFHRAAGSHYHYPSGLHNYRVYWGFMMLRGERAALYQWWPALLLVLFLLLLVKSVLRAMKKKARAWRGKKCISLILG